MAWLPQKASPSLGVAEDVSRECVEFTCANLEVLSRILHNGRFLDCVLRPISGPRLSSGIAELGLFLLTPSRGAPMACSTALRTFCARCVSLA